MANTGQGAALMEDKLEPRGTTAQVEVMSSPEREIGPREQCS